MVVIGRGEVFAGVGVDAHIGGYRGNGQDDVQWRGEACALPRRRPAETAGGKMTTGLCTVSKPGSETTRV